MDVYSRKLYALLQDPYGAPEPDQIFQKLKCLTADHDNLQAWWNCSGYLAAHIGMSSDHLNIQQKEDRQNSSFALRHPISAECAIIQGFAQDQTIDMSLIESETDIKRVFWWFWRFYPEEMAKKQNTALLIPSHKVLPDCPLHSYRSTVSALVGAMFPSEENSVKPERPYLLLFTFSPVQEFIKSSRKFLDFWAGSYLLHYLSARLCWYIAQEYGPDAVITPSLWGQEIIDAFIVQEFDHPQKQSGIFRESFQKYSIDQLDPLSRFNEQQSTHLTTAGFPNVITTLIPGKEAAEDLGRKLSAQLREEWSKIAQEIRSDVKNKVMKWLADLSNLESFELTEADQRDIQKWQQHGCWEWNKLWDAQINNTWETYWTAIPLGNPSVDLQISKAKQFDPDWIAAIEAIAPSRNSKTPTEAEQSLYQQLNVGTWWANTQSRLGNLIQSVKNTRTWNLPAAPGERSTLSGQFSALHPNLLYNDKFREGKGLSSRSMDLFWRLMSQVYPGLFNGSEKLNALELTKRMAWGYGGVPESLGINIDAENKSINYENLIRFPNLSSIAAARFAYDNSPQIAQYWRNLNKLIQNGLPKKYHDKFGSRTRSRPFHIYKTDQTINPDKELGQNYNGVMFSSKWLAEDMELQKDKKNDSQNENQVLANLVQQAHQKSNFGDGSPSDWWVIILADGDNMGKYVSGSKLLKYEQYIVKEETTQINFDQETQKKWSDLLETNKRMGPATHVGLNRALLDFSNRLVPYLTERRFCGKVIYSGGDDVMAVLPLEDLPEYLRSLRAAWCGEQDPFDQSSEPYFTKDGGYWVPQNIPELPNRPHFTMGKGATMSIGVVIAYKSVPLPTVLENIWEAEKERAKKLPGKDGICFRVIYGGGNTMEALMKGELLESWYNLLKSPSEELSPLLFRLAEELPKHVSLEKSELLSQATKVIISRRDESKKTDNFPQIENLINKWGEWVFKQSQHHVSLGTKIEDLANILKFAAFWNDKMVQRQKWKTPQNNPNIQENN